MSSPKRTRSPGSDERPLPDGWIKDFDPNTNHHFYVDTNCEPPRSCWVHPYDDPQFRREHPDQLPAGRSTPRYNPPATAPPAMKRGALGKLKDKLFGTKEEREAARIQRELEERERRARIQALRNSAPPGYFTSQQDSGFPGAQRQGYLTPNYQGYPQQGYVQQGYPQQGYPGQQPVYVVEQQQRRGFGGLGGGGLGGGFGGIGLPLVGGLAGGLLLGEALDAGDGGGGFDGGGGGGFDGGGDGGGFF